MDKKQKKKLFEMMPVLVFIGSYFILHLFNWSEATMTILAVFCSMISLLFIVTDFKVENKEKKIDFQKLNFLIAVLSIVFILIFLQGFLHWRAVISFGWRMTIMYGLLLVYFIITFRVMNVLSHLKAVINGKK